MTKATKGHRPLRLATNREDTGASNPVSAKLGGITVWAPTAGDLEFGLASLRGALSKCASRYLSAIKTVLKKQLREQFPEFEIEDRLFSAVFGLGLRMGDLDAVLCSSANDVPFRVYIHSNRITRFEECLKIAESSLKKTGEVEVRFLENLIFPQREYNTWSSAVHLLAHLSYLGLARQKSKDTYCLIDRFK